MNWVILLTEENRWGIFKEDEADRILSLIIGAESSEIDLPNASLCADFLYSEKANGIVGVSVAVDHKDRDEVANLLRHCPSSLIEWVSDGFWLFWHRCVDAVVVDAQSISVVWRAEGQSAHGTRIVAMVLEDVDYIEGEAQSELVKPLGVPYSAR